MSDQELEGAPPPSLVVGPGFFFDGQDALQLSVWNALASVAITLSGRFVHIDGRVEAFVERLVPATNRSASTAIYPRGCGWLTDLSVIVAGAAPLRGQTYARVDVVRGQGTAATVLTTLLQGYVTATKRLGYPGSPIEDSLAGQGCIRSITGTDPAANVEISEAVPTGARWRFLSMLATLVTDANPATREVALTFDDGTNVYARFPATETQIASLTTRYQAAHATPFAALQQDRTIPLMVPPLLLTAGHHFNTVTTNRQATDNWGPPQYLVEEFLEAA